MTQRAQPAGTTAAAELFAQVTASLLDQPRIEHGTGFGSMPGLRVDRKIFAMLCRDELVVKLDRHRVDELVAAGTATRFGARGDGRLLKEWATVPVAHGGAWGSLAVEALDFVGADA